MIKPIVIGLTGQTGAGKSTAAVFAQNYGAAVINADKVAREVLDIGSDCLKTLADIFGSDIINSDGSCNRSLLAKKAFSSKKNTEILNNVTHPFILNRTKEYIAVYGRNNFEFVVFDAPQLFESGGDSLCSYVIAVTAPENVRLERIILRDNISRDDALLRISAQHNQNYYTKKADFIIDGSMNIDDVGKAVKDIFQRINDLVRGL